MATLTPEKIFQDTPTHEAPDNAPEPSLHAGPVARLLARVSRWSDEYADYQMDRGSWRKLAI